MDFNSNLNQSLNGTGTFSVMPQQQNMTGTNFTTEQLLALHQFQLNAQMENMTVSNGLQPNLYSNQTVSYPTIPNLMPTSSGLMPGVLPISPTTQMPLMLFPQSSMGGMPYQQSPQLGQSIDTSQFDPLQVAKYIQLYKNIPSAVDLRKTVKRELYSPDDEPAISPQSPRVMTPYNGSSPSTPTKPNRRQLLLSDTSSTASSGPASPSSGKGMSQPSFSDYSPGPSSPKSPVLARQSSEPTPSNVQKPQPTRGSSLKYETKYPHDQCYRCMKKVYPMEKIGPVKDVVYHKGCFSCKTCGTKLNLKNFCHNKNDDLDIHIYCRSHYDQGITQPVRLDANSILIKGAMSVPKLDKVNEQIRGNDDTHRGGRLDANAVNIRAALSTPRRGEKAKTNDGRYHLDLQSLGIAHARNVPAADLQTGIKLKEHAWKREERKSESVPPPDVVRYSDVVPEYDMESYNRINVENNPDYDR